jgi:hypothetical protein
VHVNGWWLIPLGAAAAGAVALSVIAASLNRRISELRRALRPLRTGRPGRPDRALSNGHEQL